MGTLFKMVVVFGIGLGLLTGAQHLWVSWVSQRIASQSQQQLLPQTPPIPEMSAYDAQKLRDSLTKNVVQIDTAPAQRAAIVGLGQRIDIQNRNALSHVPLSNGSFGR